jgi:hypothetical protein
MSDRRLTRAKFRAWLAGMSPRAEVGVCGRVWDCPIARFLCDHGAPNARADYTGYRLTEDGKRHTPPAWASRFMCLVDEQSLSGGRSVSAGRALRLLDKAEAGR